MLAGCLAALLLAGGAATVFLVRHAEKQAGSEDPALTEAGLQRARDLALLLQDAGIDVIYSTDFRRTRDTAAPLAQHLGMEPQIYDWDEMNAFAAELARGGVRALVVGHSDTTPELVGLLGGEPGAPIDEASEYDRLYVLNIGPDGTVTTTLLRYGARSANPTTQVAPIASGRKSADSP
jgi:phosphohistidine phosphatase SixA